MSLPERQQAGRRPDIAPALFRLLAEAALSRAALDACGLPVALADAAAPERPLSYVNQAFEAFFGYRAAEVLGRPCAAFLFAEPAAAERMLREPGSQTPLRALRKDGSPVHVEVALGAVRATDGRVTHWVLAFSDRSELEALRAQLSRLST